MADEASGGLWYGRVNMNTGEQRATVFGALDAFFPAVLALGEDLDRAARLEDSCYKMWTLYGIAPELLDYKTMKAVVGSYHLRPEFVESVYYLYHYTGDEKYRRMGATFFNSLVERCKTDAGFAALADVRAGVKTDAMESYFLAEAKKYFYLLFAPRRPSTSRRSSSTPRHTRFGRRVASSTQGEEKEGPMAPDGNSIELPEHDDSAPTLQKNLRCTAARILSFLATSPRQCYKAAVVNG